MVFEKLSITSQVCFNTGKSQEQNRSTTGLASNLDSACCTLEKSPVT